MQKFEIPCSPSVGPEKAVVVRAASGVVEESPGKRRVLLTYFMGKLSFRVNTVKATTIFGHI